MRHTYLKWKGIYSNIKYHFLPVFTTAPLSSSFWLLQECCHVTHYQWILARSILTVTVAFCKKLQQKTHHIHQFEKVYGMRTIITIVKADYCFMSQLLLNILSNITLAPYPSFFVHFKHTFCHPPYQNFPFFHNCHATPKGHGLPPPPPRQKNSERAPSRIQHALLEIQIFEQNEVWNTVSFYGRSVKIINDLSLVESFRMFWS